MSQDNLVGQLFMRLGEHTGSSIDFIVKSSPDYPITTHQIEAFKDEFSEALTSILNKHFATNRVDV